MMSLPFLLLAGGIWAVATGRRCWAIGFWTAGMIVLLVLFRLHATDALNIQL